MKSSLAPSPTPEFITIAEAMHISGMSRSEVSIAFENRRIEGYEKPGEENLWDLYMISKPSLLAYMQGDSYKRWLYYRSPEWARRVAQAREANRRSTIYVARCCAEWRAFGRALRRGELV